MRSNLKPLIAVTMGDPAGIGPEIAARVIENSDIYKKCRALVVGDIPVMAETVARAGDPIKIRKILTPAEGLYKKNVLNVLQAGMPSRKVCKPGKVSAAAGQVAFAAIKKAIELAQKGEIAAVVTGPIHKASLNLAGHEFAGHTEIFAHFTHTRNYAMLLVLGNLRVIHVSTHVSLRRACELVKKKRIQDVISLLHEACLHFGISRPRIGVAGLNPHAGDSGLFGSEEEMEIEPAVQAAKRAGINVEGPIPADTLFSKAKGGKYDGCVAMYHDQGHIPFKFDGFEWDEKTASMKSVRGVNITLGLPIIRTSVDHGTAFDIAGKGIAHADALQLAIDYAIRMARYRAEHK